MPIGRGLGEKARLVFRDSGTLVQPQLGRKKSSRSVKLHPHSSHHAGHAHAGQHMRGVSRYERKTIAVSKSFTADPQQNSPGLAASTVSPLHVPTSPIGAAATVSANSNLLDDPSHATAAHMRKHSVSTVVVKTVTTVETITTTTVHGDAGDTGTADSTPPSTHTGASFVQSPFSGLVGAGSFDSPASAATAAGGLSLATGGSNEQPPPNSRQNSHTQTTQTVSTLVTRPLAAAASLKRATGGGSSNSVLGLRSSGSPRAHHNGSPTNESTLPAGILPSMSPTASSMNANEPSPSPPTPRQQITTKPRSSSITRITTTRTVREETYAIPSPRVGPIAEAALESGATGDFTILSKKDARLSQTGSGSNLPLKSVANVYVAQPEPTTEA